MLSLILSGPFAVIYEHFNSILPNCYDAIGLMFMIRIIHQHQVMLLALVIAVFIFCTFKRELAELSLQLQFELASDVLYSFSFSVTTHHVLASDPMLGFIFRQSLLSSVLCRQKLSQHRLSFLLNLSRSIFPCGLVLRWFLTCILGSLCNANVRTLWEDDIHPNYVMRRYAELTASLIHLNVEYGDGHVICF
ncbi:hypothetical protein Patl1_07166 [Pistacia atlantica]|uniref:Uncharacterized protein n=1 Tax=Pistacia atlantica TaxID=434234 RepID=A0ACC1AJP1_9ROSI|nr:hypothetical protein Patl1_07166 [Pistacia atlantica]